MTAREEVLLISMPFGDVFAPSLGLSLLKAELATQGIAASIRYFSIRFAELVGQDFYYGISMEGRPPVNSLAGEWIFSRALFGSRVENEAYVDDILRRRTPGSTDDSERPTSAALVERILRARHVADGFLEWCRLEVLRVQPRLVGFSTMFQQHVASLALARLIKQSLPDVFIVFGGANCEDVMGAETVRQFPFVDAAVSGEADLVIAELVHRALEGRPVNGLAGVRTPDGLQAESAAARLSQAPTPRNLDVLPYPDYRDYFRQFESSRYGRDWQPSIHMETSRGCWWGERTQCVFCGLNASTLAFRRKSAKRAIDELAWLSQRHPGCRIDLTDNILDMGYFQDLVPALASARRRSELFYEVKANLNKRQLELLRAAGVRSIQPGIESLSDPVLRLMRKGSSALQNIQLLKWCKELGIEVAWNLLWGFPGEPPKEYARMAECVPLLTHLPPPMSHGIMRLDRFSPGFADAERLGFAGVKPLSSYRYVYPFSDEVLARVACFFSFRYSEPRDVRGYVAGLEREVKTWSRVSKKHDLFSVDRSGWLLVWDLRRARREPLTALRGVDRLLYKACDSACDTRQLAESLAPRRGRPISHEEVARRLEPLLERGLMVKDGARYLALAIPLAEYSPSPTIVERFYDIAGTLGRRVPGGWVVSPEPARATTIRRDRSAEASARRRGRPCRWRVGRLEASHFSVSAQGEVRIRRSKL